MKPPRVGDLLAAPILGRVLCWRWGRLLGQLLLLAAAILILYDGFTGPQHAPTNLATVLVWIHYRGFVILALLLVGNVFCYACPFTLPRTLATRLSRGGIRWPKPLRNKWISILSLLALFWLYEWLDLWASPWLTAWLTAAYFAAAALLETIFVESPFCKYVCPIGAFNFTYSALSPFQISAADLDRCRTCEGKECVRGDGSVLGCGTELFVPQIEANMDCIFCLDCARACPYDNVQLRIRSPLRELSTRLRRSGWDLAFLSVALTTAGLLNAFGMVPPVYILQGWMSTQLGIESSGLLQFLITASGLVLLPALLLLANSALNRWVSAPSVRSPLRSYAVRYAPAFVPLGFGIWFAHYGFHFVTGGLSLIPVLQTFLLSHGIDLLGTPMWTLSALLPATWVFPLQVVCVFLGFMISLLIAGRRALYAGRRPMDALAELLPWSLTLFGLTVVGLMVFNLPMEMRGTIMLGR
jgi:polyferredoxin